MVGQSMWSCRLAIHWTVKIQTQAPGIEKASLREPSCQTFPYEPTRDLSFHRLCGASSRNPNIPIDGPVASEARRPTSRRFLWARPVSHGNGRNYETDSIYVCAHVGACRYDSSTFPANTNLKELSRGTNAMGDCAAIETRRLCAYGERRLRTTFPIRFQQGNSGSSRVRRIHRWSCRSFFAAAI